jgi:hypothetical protein
VRATISALGFVVLIQPLAHKRQVVQRRREVRVRRAEVGFLLCGGGAQQSLGRKIVAIGGSFFRSLNHRCRIENVGHEVRPFRTLSYSLLEAKGCDFEVGVLPIQRKIDGEIVTALAYLTLLTRSRATLRRDIRDKALPEIREVAVRLRCCRVAATFKRACKSRRSDSLSLRSLVWMHFVRRAPAVRPTDTRPCLNLGDAIGSGEKASCSSW